MNRRRFIASLGALGIVGCSENGNGARPPGGTATPSPAEPASSPPTIRSTATATATSAPPTAVPTPTPATPRDEPRGFPVDAAQRLDLVSGPVGSRVLTFGAGPSVLEYARDDQPSDDPVAANRCGWNARVHVEYEGQPAIDWYLPTGTPILATMDGTATLLVNTVSNPFDVYGVSREPFLGNPDRSRAPVNAFPGPGGGQGAFVRIENARFRTDSAHLELIQTLTAVPPGAFIGGYTAATDFVADFGPLRDFRVATAIASWPVNRGDVIGFCGDSGYSEASHLHYAIRRAGASNLLCPTLEPGFQDAGWLFP